MRFTLLTVATRTAQRLNVLLFFPLFAISDDQLKFCTAPSGAFQPNARSIGCIIEKYGLASALRTLSPYFS